MIKEFVLKIVGTAFVCIVCEFIIPEGSLKKYFRLTIGFIMMCVLMNPILNISDLKEFEFKFDGGMSEEEIRSESDAYILRLHEENVLNYIKQLCGEDVEIFIEMFADGQIKSVKIIGNDISTNTLETLKRELGCEKITITDNKEE